jgi:hypothetical protein
LVMPRTPRFTATRPVSPDTYYLCNLYRFLNLALEPCSCISVFSRLATQRCITTIPKSGRPVKPCAYRMSWSVNDN